MIKHYKKSLLSILNEVKKAKEEPFKNHIKWQFIQEKLLLKTIYVENRIRIKRSEAKEFNSFRKNINTRLNKSESLKAKNQADYYDYIINEYKFA